VQEKQDGRGRWAGRAIKDFHSFTPSTSTVFNSTWGMFTS
jgi:hypothetical protein